MSLVARLCCPTSENAVKRKADFAEHALSDVGPISLFPMPDEKGL